MNAVSANGGVSPRADDAPSILVVDDYAPNLLALEAALESLGEPLRSVSSGRLALEQMNVAEFAVALIDVQMPHLSGIELAQQLRHMGNETPIIFLTADDGDDRLREKGYQLGAVDFIVKPVEADVLRAKVSTFIKLHHQKRELARLTSSYDTDRRVARQQLRTLAAVSEKLATRVTSEEVVQAFLSEAHVAVAATNSFIYLRAKDDDAVLELAGVRGIPPEALSRFERVSLAQQLPVTSVVKSGDRVWSSDRFSLTRDFSAVDRGGKAEALAALPVIVNGGTVGAVAFSFVEKRRWDDDEREFFVTLVALLTTALERSRLLAEERKTHDELARRGEAMRLMADVGTLLSSSLDYESVLGQLTHILVPTIADWCAVDVLDQEGRIQRLSAYHSDPAKVALAHAIQERYPNDPHAPRGVPNVLRTGQSEWMADIPDELLVAATRSEEHLELARSLGLRSYIAVPLAARGKILGALSLVYAESERRYTPDDLRYAEQLAQRAALAIDNAKLFREQVEARAILERRARQALLVADVGTALARGAGSLADALQRCADAIVRHSDAALARIWTLDGRGEMLELEASSGLYPLTEGPHARIPMGAFSIGRIAKERKSSFTNDLNQEPWRADPEWLTAEGMTAFAGYPLIVGEKLKGVVAVLSPRALTEDALAGLSSIADAVALGIDRTRADHRARVERDTLEVVNEVGRSLAAELDRERLVQAVTDYSTRLAGAAFGAFFYNVTSTTGESYMLYAISGVAREEFSKFPMPRNTQVFAPTFAGQTTVRVDDIRQDPRYGHTAPYYGMPEGHLPVRSYLAVPVVSRNGTVIGGLFFGHPQPGMFTDRHEALVGGVAAQAAIAMDNARLFAEAQRLIAELDESNKDLDQFAYIASHDLKAPLRGISNLSQWLEEDLEDAITPSAKEHLALLRNRVARMEGLINGILDYSRAGRLRTKPETVHVGKLLAEIIEMISVPEGAFIDVQPGLPELRTERVPLQQVFMNLLNNAIKHAKRADPRVTVTARDEGDFIEFAVADNGPGIAPEFHERIWGIFQTLEPRDVVEGTGIGLSVVKKIVGHKGGRVDIESREGAGAKFMFTWPKSEKATNV
jgi:GAF domain-containing protein/ActR/RegA family two-component response regulator/anti-sigma regulatory factor (Ser/Thr protein kinase)